MTARQDGEKPALNTARSLRLMRRQLARAVVISALTFATGGCVFAPAQSFTLQADVPADFRVKADAYYVPATGETCEAPPRQRGKVAPNRKFFKSEYQNVARTAQFQIPLTTRAGGCPLVLRSVKLNLRAKWGPDRWDTDGDFASLSVLDELGAASSVVSGTQEFQGQCQWLFRTVSSTRLIVKILHCRATDADGQVVKQMAGGVLQRDQLPGRTVRMVFKMAARDQPYYRGWWFETAKGWQPCTGRWGTSNEELCTEPPRFTDFKLPDGRTCTVYPDCTE